MKNQNEPFIHPLIQISKKYIGLFAEVSQNIPLERYHYVLVLIQENKQNLTQKDLAEFLLVDKSFMVNMIDYLTAEGFVYRETSKEDRRKHLIKLTDKAVKYLPSIKEAITNANNLALAGVSENHQSIFNEVLSVVEKNLKINNQYTVSFDYKKSDK